MAHFSISKEQSVCECWNTSPLNPQQWDLTPKRVAEVAAIILAICVVSILVPELMMQYPKASGACFMAFGVIGVIALTILCIATIKHCREENKPGIHIRLPGR